MKILNELPPEAEKGQLVAMDTEFFGMTKGKLHRPTGTFACISIAMDKHTVHQLYDEKQVKDALKLVSKGTWVFHNALFDLRQLRRYAPIKPRFIWDTMLVEQAMCGGLYQTFSLKDLVRRWLNETMDKEARDEFETSTEMSHKAKEYAANDAVKTLQVAYLQQKTWEDTPAFRAYTEVDEPMIFPVLDMPGIYVDVERWTKMVKEFQEKVHGMEDALGINVMSGPQVIKEAKHHGVFIMNTQAVTLQEFKNVPFIAKVLEARTYRKAVSTYGESWLSKSVDIDGRVYSSYHITGTETGRMSSSDPNMQQIPARVLPQYRAMFVASPKSVILVSDVSQQEPRILAHESKDRALLEAFRNKEDIYLTVARAIFNDPKIGKEDDRRKIAKNITLGTSYGLTEFGLATRLNITEDEAANFLKQYFARFSGVHSWMTLQHNFGLQNEYVKTTLGRRIYLNIYQSQWMNNSINAPIQGGAADFTKIWIRKIWEKCREAKIPFFVVEIVHDEVVQDVAKELVKQAKQIVSAAFEETAARLYPTIPFAFETEMGRSWACKSMPEEAILEEE